MGTYLSTPVTEKGREEGETFSSKIPCAWGITDMQGWRKTMEDAHVARTDLELGGQDAKVFGVFDGHGGPEVARFCALYMVSVLQQHYNESGDAGEALVATFHALDRMIDDPSRREELLRLRAIVPALGEQRDLQPAAPQTPAPPREPTRSVTPEENGKQQTSKDDDVASDLHSTATTETTEVSTATESTQVAVSPENKIANDMICDGVDEEEDADSLEPTGKDEAADNDEDLSSDEDLECDAVLNAASTSKPLAAEEALDQSAAGKVTGMFQRLLNLKGPSGELVLHVGQNGVVAPNATSSLRQATPNASLPSVIRNGQMMCNLPDHPIHAGATAIVAVLADRTLTVANAGDSRAVLCRAGGGTMPLSFDHKPSQPTEHARIRAAGGFVNSFGRVNGNLNLSRSIGDLKYKQVPHRTHAQQMITAEPDISEVTLAPDDEFIILGCDGIWDCLTNEKAVEFVRARIDDMKPAQIGVEMLDLIISDDPRATQGIGGDNMTVMIIDLQPHSRRYRQPADVSPI